MTTGRNGAGDERATTDENRREQRAREITATAGTIEVISDDMFTVRSQSGPGAYRVTLVKENGTCNCPDQIKNGGENRKCKHILAVRFYLQKETFLSTGETIQEKIPITYPQAWEAYDRAQTEEIRLFDILLKDLLADVPDPERDPHRAGRPPIPIRDEFFCAIQKTYSQKSLRRAWGLFRNSVERGHLPKAPHYTVPSKFLNREDITPLLHSLITKTALPLASLEEGFAPDSTGIRKTSFGAWREEKHGERRTNVWLKCHALVGIKTHVVVQASVTDKDGADINEFEPLLRQAAEAGFHLREVYADKAYSARASYALSEEVGFDLYVPFKSNASPNVVSRGHRPSEQPRSRLWKQAFHFFQLHRSQFEAKYHKRSNVESVFSAIKRKLGETLRSRNQTAQVNELLCKLVAYNITVLIHEMFENGVVPEFLQSAPMLTA